MRIVDLHPAIKGFPQMDDAAYAALHNEIKLRGQRRPIALFEGMIWDGRSRYDACHDLKIEPKYRILKRKDEPIIYLIKRDKPNRYGSPSSPERHAALEVLQKIYEQEWIDNFKKRRATWLSQARRDFRNLVDRAAPCAVCKQHIEFVHAHHTLPLNVQFDLGLEVEDADHTHDWLCPKHHRFVHMLISVWITDTREDNFLDQIHDDDVPEWNAVEAVYEHSMALFKGYGGMNGNGRGHDYSEWEP